MGTVDNDKQLALAKWVYTYPFHGTQGNSVFFYLAECSTLMQCLYKLPNKAIPAHKIGVNSR